MDRQELIKVYNRTVQRIDNAERWFATHDPVDDDSKEYRLLLELIKKANKLYYELFVLGGEGE